MLHNVSWLEALFTSVGVLVLPLVIIAFPDVQEDYVIARDARRKILPDVLAALEVKYQQARDNRSEEIDRLLILVWCIAIGTRLMTQPPSPGGPITLTTVMFSFGIIMVELVVARRSIIKRLTRNQQLRMLSDPKRAKQEAIEAIIQKRQRLDDHHPPFETPSEAVEE